MAKVDRHGIGPADTRFGGNLEMANRRQQYDPRTFDWNPSVGDILSSRTDQNVKHRGSETDSWTREFVTTRNPYTNRVASESVVEHGPNMISNRFVYPSGYGKDYATGEEFQLKGPQTWMYDPPRKTYGLPGTEVAQSKWKEKFQSIIDMIMNRENLDERDAKRYIFDNYGLAV